MTKVVINADYGGFGLSVKAIEAIAERKGISVRYFDRMSGRELDANEARQTNNGRIAARIGNLERDDADLVAVVEELGKAANDEVSSLKIVEVPDDVVWCISDYDGWEEAVEVHRRWG